MTNLLASRVENRVYELVYYTVVVSELPIDSTHFGLQVMRDRVLSTPAARCSTLIHRGVVQDAHTSR